MKNILTTLFNHHLWANLCLLEACRNLSKDQLDARIAGSYGTIYETLQHFVTSEQSYFSRISTGQPRRRPADAPPMTMQEMAESLQTTGSGLIEWANKVEDGETVEIDWEGTPREVPKAILFTQCINHATEHREQIKAILTELGIEPPDLQGWEYFEHVWNTKNS
jgi:uncharacterized damage-inducible protein DinB